jgi:predicted DCC family thiol-disulfide oxidoreductase YuxK
MDKMTTQTLYSTTCTLCDNILNTIISAGVKTNSFFESVSRARAASALSQMGYHEEAKRLMLGN